MFLNELSERQAVAFLNLVAEFALSDNKIDETEEAIISKFCKEMNLSESKIQELSEEEAYKIVEDSSERITNIMYFELMRVGLADDKYDFEEVNFIEKFGDNLKVPRAKRMEIVNYFYDYPDAEPKNYEEAKAAAEKILNEAAMDRDDN